MPTPSIKSVTLTPQVVNTGQTFTISVDAEFFPVNFNDLETNALNWDSLDTVNTWSDIDMDTSQVRYIRDYLGQGSTANTSNHWVEIQAIDMNGTNVALNKTAYVDNNPSLTVPNLVDGNTDTNQWSIGNMSAGTYKTIDLGQVYTLDKIIVWHYYGDGRTYLFNKTQISVDGIKWVTIFDSSVEGTYAESYNGHEINL